MINNPQNFFDQVRNLCEELGLRMKSIGESLSTYLTKSEAEKYLEKTEASNTYLGKSDKAASASVADSATSANTASRATSDASGNNISSTYLKIATASSTYLTKTEASSSYLGKTAKAESAKTADTATSATSAGTATKAIQDGDGNVISGTYLKSATAQSTYLSKTDATSTYLGKTAKAESAKTADSATKATQDGSGNVIEQTYLKTAPVTSVNGQTGDVSINVTAPVTSVNGMVGAVTIDRVNNAGWADGAWSATVTPSVQTANQSGNRIYAPAGGTWWCHGGYYTVTQDDNASGTSYEVNGTYAGGALIADAWDSINSCYIMCIRIA